MNCGATLQSFTISHLGRLQFKFDAEFPFDLLAGHLKMHLTNPGKQSLMGLLLAVQLQGKVFIKQASNRGEQLFLITLLGADRIGNHCRQRFKRGINNRIGFIAQGVAGGGFLQLGHCHDHARKRRIHRFLLLATHDKELTEALACILVGIVKAVALEGAGKYAKNGESAGKRIGHGFEHQGGKRSTGIT